MRYPKMLSEVVTIEALHRDKTYNKEIVFVDVGIWSLRQNRSLPLVRLDAADPEMVKKPAYIAVFEIASGNDYLLDTRLYAADTQVRIHRLDFDQDTDS